MDETEIETLKIAIGHRYYSARLVLKQDDAKFFATLNRALSALQKENRELRSALHKHADFFEQMKEAADDKEVRGAFITAASDAYLITIIDSKDAWVDNDIARSALSPKENDNG